MFCTNCGAKLPEGSKFCMECGARIELETPAPSTNDWNKPLETVVDQEPVETVAAKRPAISFDWSNVKEESHKKEIPEVHSPWGTTGLSEKELFSEIGTPSDDHSRTMSFIDILKKERDAKAQAAEEETRELTEREEPASDYSAFDAAPSFYVPPLYDDVEGPTVTPFDEEETPAFEAPAEASSFEESTETPAFEEPKKEFEEFEEIEIPSFNAAIFETEEPTPVVKEQYHTTSFDTADIRATEDLSDLEASLAAILEAGAGKPVETEEKIDLFEGVSNDESVEDLYLDVQDEEPVVEAVEEPAAEDSFKVEIAEFEEEDKEVFGDGAIPEAILDFTPKHGGTDFTVEDEDDLDEEELEELENLYISSEDIEGDETAIEDSYDEPEMVIEPEALFDDETEAVEETVAEVVEETVEEEPESVESEIEALKRRLAELMGEPEEPEEILKPEATTAEELFGETVAEATNESAEVVEAVAEPEPTFEEAFDVELKDEEPEEEEEFEVEVITEEVEADEEEASSEQPASDAISLEELEKDLFGDANPDETEPEATKKIDKFYTLYKKNEEFQRLLDEEYNKLQNEEKVPHVEDFVPVEVVKDEPAETVQPKVEETAKPVEAAPAPVKEETAAPAPVAEEPKTESAAIAKAEAKAEKEAEAKAEREAAKAEREAAKAARKAEKEAAKEAKKAARAAAADDDEEQAGGGALTILAVIVAALLVILLAIILVLNFAPDSAIAMSIDSVIETITSYFSAADTFNGPFLL